MLNSGLEDKVGPHRLYVTLARLLCRAGYTVLRFDNAGIGESAGELGKGTNYEKYVQIEGGLFVEDARCALEYLKEAAAPETVVLLGHCGGGVTAMLAAGEDSRVDGAVLLATPVYMDSMERPVVSPLEARERFRAGKGKIFSPATWLKLVTLRMDVAYLLKMFSINIRYACGRKERRETELASPLNARFAESFVSVAKSGRKVLFIFPGKDQTTREFLHSFQDRYVGRYGGAVCETVRFENANHEFHSPEAKEMLVRAVLAWLQANYAAAGAGA
jgi:alpha-beta hydrolase superfamily lysophospholipase